MRRIPASFLTLAALASAAATGAHPRAAHAQGAPQAVYVNLADSVRGSLDEAATALRGAFVAAGWEVLAAYAAGVEAGACDFGARVLVAHSPRYARAVMLYGPRAAFAVPLRLVVYQDEAGTHVAAANPMSVNRTVVAEQGFDDESARVLEELGRIVADAHLGVPARRQYGQLRRRGLIGRTMGIMAGGPFVEKVEVTYATPGDTPDDLRRVAEQVWQAVQGRGGRGRWQLGPVYRLDLADQGVVIIGVSGGAMEARAFRIVGAGSDDRRQGYRCPGLAYAAAFPVEVVVMREGGEIRVTLVDEMYRMKMYFEDAGKVKFAANMGMPGSIEDEVRRLVALGTGSR